MMILADDDKLNPADSTSGILRPSNVASASDTPPPYTTSHSHLQAHLPSLPETGPSQYVIPPLLTQRPCNWLYAHSSNGRIKDRYILDPSLKVPTTLLSEAAADIPENERNNLNLSSSNGAVDVIARIVDSSSRGKDVKGLKPRVRITLHSYNGSVTGKILSVAGDPPPKFQLTASTHTGAVFLYIPRSFHGPISASTSYGSIQFSKELEENLTTFADGHARKCFVGDYSDFDDNEERKDEWDQLILESRFGAVKVWYTDEWETKEREKETKRKTNEGKSFLGRIFGI